MHTPDSHEHESHNKPASVREGYEVTDVSVRGIMVFLVGLFISVGVFFVFCFGMGKVINNALAKRDGPANQWNQGSAEAGKTYRMQSNPAMEQQQLQQMTTAFLIPPTCTPAKICCSTTTAGSTAAKAQFVFRSSARWS